MECFPINQRKCCHHGSASFPECLLPQEGRRCQRQVLLDLLSSISQRADHEGQQGTRSPRDLLRHALLKKEQDFFYICAGHLTDRGFATPDKDELAAAEARKKQAELDAEIEKVKKEYAEKIKKKAEKKAEKDKDGKDKSKDDAKAEKDKEKSEETELEDKVSGLNTGCDEDARARLTSSADQILREGKRNEYA